MNLYIEYDQYRDALLKAGIDSGGELVEGKRTRATCSCKPTKTGLKGNGWYLYYADEPATLVWGCWNTGCPNHAGGKLSAKREQELTPAERDKIKARIEADRKSREEERQQAEKGVKEKAAYMWGRGKEVLEEHEYIRRKGIKPLGAQLYKTAVMIPLSATGGGKPETLQMISPDGSKKFLNGTWALPGPLFHVIDVTDTGPLYVVEGWATGCSVHEATGATVVIAFSSGKLAAVARVIQERYTEREIVIAGDTGNGSEKATEAARLIGGKVVFPTMPDGISGTDFNDLHQSAGLEEVARQLTAATVPEKVAQKGEREEEPDIEHELRRLASMKIIQYERLRATMASTLGIRATVLDKLVAMERKAVTTNGLIFDEVDPHGEPVNGAALLDEIKATVKRFIVCKDDTATAVTLWIAATWFVDVAQVAPIAMITAPEMRCGKSQLLSFMGKLSYRPVQGSSLTSAVVFRMVEKYSPTLFIDEADAFMKDNEEMRLVINGGHTRDSAYIYRTVGDNHEPARFSIWGFKAIAGISASKIAGTITDRSVVLELRRKLDNEQVDRLRYCDPELFTRLASMLARFAEDNREALRECRPVLPGQLNDRQQDNWEPLLAIATVAGGHWLTTATQAALSISGTSSPTVSTSIELLQDIKQAFEERKVDRISTADLLTALFDDTEAPWLTYNRGGKPMTARQLAGRLREFGVHSTTLRIGTVPSKGYSLAQLEDVFSRYLNANVTDTSVTSDFVTDSKTLNVTDNSSKSLPCYAVTDRLPLKGAKKTQGVVTESIDLRGVAFEVVP